MHLLQVHEERSAIVVLYVIAQSLQTSSYWLMPKTSSKAGCFKGWSCSQEVIQVPQGHKELQSLLQGSGMVPIGNDDWGINEGR